MRDEKIKTILEFGYGKMKKKLIVLRYLLAMR